MEELQSQPSPGSTPNSLQTHTGTQIKTSRQVVIVDVELEKYDVSAKALKVLELHKETWQDVSFGGGSTCVAVGIRSSSIHGQGLFYAGEVSPCWGFIWANT